MLDFKWEREREEKSIRDKQVGEKGREKKMKPWSVKILVFYRGEQKNQKID